MQACPYDARYFDPERGIVDNCTLCVYRLDVGQPPACVETCVGGSPHAGDLNDPNSKVSQLLAKHGHTVMYEEAGTEPKIFYIP
jgi:tetrathionate reductase subunit B